MRITALAGIILITALAAQPAHAQTYKVKLQQTVTPGTLTVDIMIGMLTRVRLGDILVCL